MRRNRFYCAVLLALSFLHQPLTAQRLSGQPATSRLKIAILEGQDAVNSLEEGRAVTPVVEVRDSNDLPIENAEVTFQLPAQGPGGQFRDGSRSLTAKTNLQGQAQAPFNMNSEAGEFAIRVTARIGESESEATIRQQHIVGSPQEFLRKREKRWYKSWRFWALVGGAAAGAVVAVVVTGSDSSGGGVVITPGPPTVGGPQ